MFLCVGHVFLYDVYILVCVYILCVCVCARCCVFPCAGCVFLYDVYISVCVCVCVLCACVYVWGVACFSVSGVYFCVMCTFRCVCGAQIEPTLPVTRDPPVFVGVSRMQILPRSSPQLGALIVSCLSPGLVGAGGPVCREGLGGLGSWWSLG